MVNARPTPHRNLGRLVSRIVLGLALGYLAYLPGLALILFVAYGRIQTDMFLYGLYLPFQLPLLASARFRETLTANEFLLQSFSLVLMAFTTFIALTMHGEQPADHRAEIKHG